MAFDPRREDYQRLGLRYAASLDGADAATATRAFANFGHRFSQDRDSLPQTDEDRAFYLVVKATSLIDYQLPFSSPGDSEKLIERGHQLLDEALSLDVTCYDALRMKAAADSISFDSYHAFLAERANEVVAHCEKRRDQAGGVADGERARLAADLAMRPCLRWLATQAEQSLICGRNREALRVTQRMLELDPTDAADARFTAALAYAKLEDEADLDALASRTFASAHRAPDDGWMQLARVALAHKAHDLARARSALQVLIQTYPHAAETLIRQSELPDGVFARLAVLPYSEDELILAVSEGTVLLQEGRDSQDRGVLGRWVAEECARMSPSALRSVMSERERMEQAGSGTPSGHGRDSKGPGESEPGGEG